MVLTIWLLTYEISTTIKLWLSCIKFKPYETRCVCVTLMPPMCATLVPQMCATLVPWMCATVLHKPWMHAAPLISCILPQHGLPYPPTPSTWSSTCMAPPGLVHACHYSRLSQQGRHHIMEIPSKKQWSLLGSFCRSSALQDDSWMRDAFSYEWRVWQIEELRAWCAIDRCILLRACWSQCRAQGMACWMGLMAMLHAGLLVWCGLWQWHMV